MKKIYNIFMLFTLLLSVVLTSCHDREAKDVRSQDDLPGARIGVLAGSTIDMLISELYDEKDIMRYNVGPDMLMALDAGKVDVVVDESMGRPMIEMTYPQFEFFDFTGGEEMDISIGVINEQKELYEQLNAFIDSLKSEGIFDQMLAKWRTREGVLGEVEVARSQGTGKPIKVATSADYAPFTFVYKGLVTGFEPELMELFADRMNRKVEYSIVDFPAVVPHVVQGLSDVACAALTTSDDRSGKILFSTPYLTSGPLCVIKSKTGEGSTVSFSVGGMFDNLKQTFVANLIKEDRYKMILDGLGVTLVITLFSILFGTLLGALLCWMRMHRRRWIVKIAMIYVELMRGIPVLVLLLLMFYVILTPLQLTGVVVAIITFSLNSAAYFCEMFRTAISSIDRGQTEAGLALGFSRLKTFLYIILPQSVHAVLPVYISEVVSTLKGTAIVGYVAVTDLTKAGDLIRSRTFDAFFPLIVVSIIYFTLAWLAGIALQRLTIKKTPQKVSDNRPARKKTNATFAQTLAKDENQDPLIVVSRLCKTYDNGLQVLTDVNAEIRRGEVISIIGPSGTGKSTFLRCLNQLETASAGSIIIDGADILDKKADLTRIRQKMGMVFQSFNLFNGRTILDNITLAPIKLLGKSKEEATRQALELLDMVGLLSKANQYPDQLSGGQKQRVAIARALAMEPQILLFDEPTSALDPSMVSEVLAVIRTLAQKGLTMLVVTHEMRFARDVSSRIFYMDEGVIYEAGSPEQIFDHPEKKNTRIFVNLIRECRHTITEDNDYYGMVGVFLNFCLHNGFSRTTTDNVQHIIEEVLLVVGDTAGTEIVLTYSEKTSETEISFEHLPTIDKDILNLEENQLQAAIIRNSSKSITIEQNRMNLIVR